MTRGRVRRLHRLGDARHHPRRPHRLRAVLQSGLLRRPPARDPASCGTAACRSTAASSAASSACCCSPASAGIPFLSLGDVTCAVGPIGLFLGRIANFVNGELWGREADVPWAMVFPSGGPAPAPPEPALRGGAGRPRCCSRCSRADPARRAEAAGPDHRAVRGRLRDRAHRSRVLPRAGRAARLPLGRRHHGHAAVDPAASPRRRLHRHALRASAARRAADGNDAARARDPRAHRRRRADRRSTATWRWPRPPARTATTSRATRSARAAISSPRPKSSQMFGELIGAWAATVWPPMGAPERAAPGRARPRPRHADGRRAARREARARLSRRRSTLHLVETSPVLREAQQQRALASSGVAAAWHADLADVPAGPAIVVANEFFDALPVHQFVKTQTAGTGAWGRRRRPLAFSLAPDPIRIRMPDARGRARRCEGRSSNGAATAAMDLGRRLARDGGAALIIDYGHTESAFGDTLQAVPPSLRRSAGRTGRRGPHHARRFRRARARAEARARAHGPVTQGAFLRRLGIEPRAARLKANATRAAAAEIDVALAPPATGPDGRIVQGAGDHASRPRRAAGI